MINYSQQSINEADIKAVTDALRSPMLTTGPRVSEFEKKFAKKVGAKHAVSFSNGTSALYFSMRAAHIEPGDEVIVPAMTFCATATAVKYMGGTPVFADVNPDTLLIDAEDVKRKITDKTKAVVTVDYAGQKCELKTDLPLISDSCHSLIHHEDALVSCHSFHPVKHITTGEGGMITTDSGTWSSVARSFRNHGRVDGEMYTLGNNYRMSDIQAALGVSQLRKLDYFMLRRGSIALEYDIAFKGIKGITPLKRIRDRAHSNHLYVIKVDGDRDKFREHLAENGIGTQIHYDPPVHLQPYYRGFGNKDGDCPDAEKVSKQIVSIPCYPDLSDQQQNHIIETIKQYFQ